MGKRTLQANKSAFEHRGGRSETRRVCGPGESSEFGQDKKAGARAISRYKRQEDF